MARAEKGIAPSIMSRKSHGLIDGLPPAPVELFAPPPLPGRNCPIALFDNRLVGSAHNVSRSSSRVPGRGDPSGLATSKSSPSRSIALFVKSRFPSLPPVPSSDGNCGSPFSSSTTPAAIH